MYWKLKNQYKKQEIYQKLRLNKKNFFLYDDGNYINHTFYTELNKKLQIYGLILTSGIGIKTTNLTRPENSLKFRVLYNKYMDHIVLQLEDKKTRKNRNKGCKSYKFFNFISKT